MENRDHVHVVDRRAFTTRALAALAAVAFSPRLLWPQPGHRFVIGIALASGHDEVAQGIELGLQEALRSGLLFGKTVTSAKRTWVAEADAASAAVDLVRLNQASVVIGGGSETECRILIAACSGAKVPFLNVVSRADEFRRTDCLPMAFHVEASDAMYASAQHLASASTATASDMKSATKSGCDIVAWHSSLERYGASQLNDRFAALAHRAMTGPAWAGWMAVKIVSEAYFRTGAIDGPSLTRYLSAESTQFDGHKGAALSFRGWDHQLRQPLYCVAHEPGQPPRVTDVPDLSRSDRSARELLDMLGDSASLRTCEAIK